MQSILDIDYPTKGGSTGAVRRSLFAALSCVIASVIYGASPSFADVTSLDLTDTTADATLPRESGGQSAELLSAFFGLDNGQSRNLSRCVRPRRHAGDLLNRD